MHILHKWSKWSEVIEGFSGKTQWRVCKMCSEVGYRCVGYGQGANASQVNEVIIRHPETLGDKPCPTHQQGGSDE